MLYLNQLTKCQLYALIYCILYIYISGHKYCCHTVKPWSPNDLKEKSSVPIFLYCTPCNMDGSDDHYTGQYWFSAQVFQHKSEYHRIFLLCHGRIAD